MILREMLNAYLQIVVKPEYHPSAEREQYLIESHLEALQEIDRLIAQLREKE